MSITMLGSTGLRVPAKVGQKIIRHRFHSLCRCSSSPLFHNAHNTRFSIDLMPEQGIERSRFGLSCRRSKRHSPSPVVYASALANGDDGVAPKGNGKSSYIFAAVALGISVLVTGVLFQKFHVPLSKSGFFASLSLIFASEIGDKTFFIAALLAMRYGRILSLLGSVSSLSLMTVISVIIGYAVQRVPTVVESSEIVGKYLSAASLLYFGLKSLFTAATQADSTAGEELTEAEEQVASAEESGSITTSGNSVFAAFMEIAGLIFVAEWGDRSMLATIALGAAQSPIGVAGGAIVGHTVATMIAVAGGAALADKISERTVNIIGGALFILFAIATAFGLY